jgi:hypothetical protein
MKMKNILIFGKHLLFILLVLTVLPLSINAHQGWQEHVNDMMLVFGFNNNTSLRGWMKFISSDMIDSRDAFYNKLCNNHKGFGCDHRLLFHWGYNAIPWNQDLEDRVRLYCEQYDLNEESNIRIFKSEILDEQKRRNRLMKEKAIRLFGFKDGEDTYISFFNGIAYDVHIVGDYTSDNTKLGGLQKLSDVIGLIVIQIRNLDKYKSKSIINGITAINLTYSNDQQKADHLMIFLKYNIPKFIKVAQDGSIRRRLEKRGFSFR